MPSYTLPTSWRSAATTSSSSAPSRRARVAVCRQCSFWVTPEPSAICALLSSSASTSADVRLESPLAFAFIVSAQWRNCSGVHSDMAVGLRTFVAERAATDASRPRPIPRRSRRRSTVMPASEAHARRRRSLCARSAPGSKGDLDPVDVGVAVASASQYRSGRRPGGCGCNPKVLIPGHGSRRTLLRRLQSDGAHHIAGAFVAVVIAQLRILGLEDFAAYPLAVDDPRELVHAMPALSKFPDEPLAPAGDNQFDCRALLHLLARRRYCTCSQGCRAQVDG